MKPDKIAFPDDVTSAPEASVRTPPITIDEAVEALTLDVDGRRYTPPMFDELYADVIIDRLTSVMGALTTLTVLELEGDQNIAGVDLHTSDCLAAKHLVFQSLEYLAALASVLLRQGRVSSSVWPQGAPPKREGGAS